MPKDKKNTVDLIIGLPVYNEIQAIESVLTGIRDALVDIYPNYQILVVDDGSTDGTSKKLDSMIGIMDGLLKVIKHPYNLGNGAAVKSCIREAQGKYLVLMDADMQHDPKDILKLAAELDQYDLVVGSRDFKSKGFWPRRLANLIFDGLASYLTGFKIKDLTSGFRGFRLDVIKGFVHLLPNRFSYPTTSTMAFIKAGYTVKFVPIVAQKRVGKSKLNPIRDGMRFLIIIAKMVIFFEPMKVFFPTSILLFILAVVSFVLALLNENRLYIPNSAVFLSVSAIIIFLIGAVAEQVSALRVSLESHKSDS